MSQVAPVILHGVEPSCPACAKGARRVLLHTRLSRIANDEVFCPKCGRVFDIFLEERRKPEVITLERLCGPCTAAVLGPQTRVGEHGEVVPLPILCADCQATVVQCLSVLLTKGHVRWEEP